MPNDPANVRQAGRPEEAAYGLFRFTELFTEEIDGNEYS